MLWLDEQTLVVGRGYRTNDAGVDALRASLPDVEVYAVDLPHYHGRDEVMHLLSLISPLADDLALVYLPLMPVRLVELLEQRGVGFVEVPDDEFESMACNVLALAPRVALTLDGNPETRTRLEAAGVDVRVYSGEELSRKGDGGPTCLTRPLVRATRPDVLRAPSATASRLLRRPRTRHALDLQTRLQDHDVPPERTGEPDLGQRPPTAADRDHRVAGSHDCEVARMADAGDDGVVDPFVGFGARLAGKDPDRRASRRLRAPRGRRHHLTEPAAHDGRPALREQPPDLLRARLMLGAAADHRDLRHGVRRRSVAAASASASRVTAKTIAASRAMSTASPPSTARCSPS